MSLSPLFWIHISLVSDNTCVKEDTPHFCFIKSILSITTWPWHVDSMGTYPMPHLFAAVPAQKDHLAKYGNWSIVADDFRSLWLVNAALLSQLEFISKPNNVYRFSLFETNFFLHTCVVLVKVKLYIMQNPFLIFQVPRKIM